MYAEHDTDSLVGLKDAAEKALTALKRFEGWLYGERLSTVEAKYEAICQELEVRSKN